MGDQIITRAQGMVVYQLSSGSSEHEHAVSASGREFEVWARNVWALWAQRSRSALYSRTQHVCTASSLGTSSYKGISTVIQFSC